MKTVILVLVLVLMLERLFIAEPDTQIECGDMQ